MTTGTVHRWSVGEGSAVRQYDLVYEVSTRQLLEEPTPNEVVMEVEVHEDGYLAKILAREGVVAAPDEPIAILCEEEEHISAFANYTPPAGTVVPAGQFIWQAYLVSGLEAKECGK